MCEDEVKSNNLLFHYTNVKSALNILASGVLYFRHYSGMNDPTEFHYADRYLSKAAEEALDFIFKEDKSFQTSIRGVKYAKYKREDSENLLAALSQTLGDDYYIFSATQHGNNYEKLNGSLVMWRGYGHDEGCAIVFDKRKLVDSVHSITDTYKASTVDGQVCYSGDFSVIKKFFDADYLVFFEYLKHLYSSQFLNNKCSLYPQVDGVNPYIKMKALLKHHAYASENEYRLSVIRNVPILRIEDSDLIPKIGDFIHVPINKGIIPIKKIIIGPMKNQNKNRRILTDFITSNPAFQLITVTESEIPHR